MKDREPIIINISSLEDIQKLEKIKTIKYVSIDINNPNPDVINYFLEKGEDYCYAETITNKPGYIYVDYDVFKEGEQVIDTIISSMPSKLNKLEQARYLYIKLGSIVGIDINAEPTKNEDYNLNTINIINNPWGALSTKKITPVSLTKLYYYLCRLLDIECYIIPNKDQTSLENQLCIDGNIINVCLLDDLPNIQGKFKTASFGSYNDNETIDKKIGYIKKGYNNKPLIKALQNIDITSGNFLEEVLTKTSQIIEIPNIKPIELSLIYQAIFEHNFPNNPVSINNLYINDSYNNKEHFLLFTYQDEHYSFNYNRNCFVNISDYDLRQNIENNKIGVYQNEDMPRLSYCQKAA